MEQLNNWNVDGIFTNLPDSAKELGLENKKIVTVRIFHNGC